MITHLQGVIIESAPLPCPNERNYWMEEVSLKSAFVATALVALTTMTANFAVAVEKKKTTDDKKKMKMEFTKEQREDMAMMHEKMVTCLRSDKPMEDCRDEMMGACKDQMGKEGCPMMGEMKYRGKMRNKMPDKMRAEMHEKSEKTPEKSTEK